MLSEHISYLFEGLLKIQTYLFWIKQYIVLDKIVYLISYMLYN